MQELIDIQKSVQEIAEAIYAILKIEVTVVDTNLTRIAATDIYKDSIGEKLPSGCSYEYILKNLEIEYIGEKNSNQRCYSCESYNGCNEIATIGYPILSADNKILGVLGLVAFNDKEHKYIVNNLNDITEFINKLSSLLSIIFDYNQLVKDSSLKNKEILNMINSLDQGVILTNEDFQIINFNHEALRLLNCSKTDILGKNMSSLFNDFDYSIKNNIVSYYNEDKRTNQSFMVKTIKNKLNKDTKSYIIYISEYTKVLIDAYNVIDSNGNKDFDNILGESFGMKRAKQFASHISNSDSNVIIRGASGTGKELFARAIHNNSKRDSDKFIAINCSAIPDNLLESELFGYEKGAFSGADSSGKIGRFELANGGTLFLDEIGDMPIYLQPKLLRVLQEGYVTRLGSNKEIEVDFRLITATNRELEKMIEDGKFREDLYYRINVMPVIIPSLNERKEDIMLIANAKLKEFCSRLSKEEMSFSQEIIDLFINADWKGNVRELENVLEYMVNVSNTSELTKLHLPSYFKQSYTSSGSNSALDTSNLINLDKEKSLKEYVKEFEKNLMRIHMDEYGDSTEAKEYIAKKLKINLSTLYRKLY